MGRYGAQLHVYPLWHVTSLFSKEKFESSVEFAATYTNWSTLDSDGVFDADRSSAFFQARLTYAFNAKEPKTVFRGVLQQSEPLEIGVTLQYENGEDPQLGLRDIDQLTLGLTVRF